MRAKNTMIDPTRLGRVVAVLTWIWFAADALLSLSAIEAVYVLGGLGGEVASDDRLKLSDDIGQLTSLIEFATYLLAGAAILRWIYVVNRNAHALGGKISISPRAGVLWFFVPIAQFWKPFAGVRESWQATVNPSSPASVPVPAMMRYWWGAWIVMMAGNMPSGLMDKAPAPDQSIAENWFLASTLPIDLILTVTLLSVVRRLSRLQKAALARRQPEPSATEIAPARLDLDDLRQHA